MKSAKSLQRSYRALFGDLGSATSKHRYCTGEDANDQKPYTKDTFSSVNVLTEHDGGTREGTPPASHEIDIQGLTGGLKEPHGRFASAVGGDKSNAYNRTLPGENAKYYDQESTDIRKDATSKRLIEACDSGSTNTLTHWSTNDQGDPFCNGNNPPSCSEPEHNLNALTTEQEDKVSTVDPPTIGASRPRLTYHETRPSSNVSFDKISMSSRDTDALVVNAPGSSYEAVKPFSAIPGPRGVPGVGDLLGMLYHGGLTNKMHVYYTRRQQQYGPIMRLSFGPLRQVFVWEPQDVRAVLRQEGSLPRRTALTPWVDYRRLRGLPTGVLLSDYEPWQKHRSALNRPLLRPAAAAAHTPAVSSVAALAVERLAEARAGGGGVVRGVQDVLFKYALEASSAVLLGRRLGCLDAVPPASSTRFVRAIKQLQADLVPLMMLPPGVAQKLNLAAWRRTVECWDSVLAIGKTYAEPSMSCAPRREADSDSCAGGVVGSLVRDGRLTTEEIYASVFDALSAAVDSTTSAICWVLAELALNPAEQETLAREVRAVLPRVGEVADTHVRQLHYLKAVIKEALRLHPLAFSIVRILDEDIVLRGYNIPAQTIVGANLLAQRHSALLYHEPVRFMPERWLQDSGHHIDPYCNIVFGMGKRSCIGRRLAELSMQLLIAKVVQRWTIHPVDPARLRQEASNFLLLPANPTDLRLVDRE